MTHESSRSAFAKTNHEWLAANAEPSGLRPPSSAKPSSQKSVPCL
jgi:hypothetical protein